MQHTTFLRQKVLFIVIIFLWSLNHSATILTDAHSTPKTPSEPNVWIGHGPEGGSIQVLALDPMTPTTLYAGTKDGGIFKSTDGGENWAIASIGLANLGVFGLVIDPTMPNILYAGTYGAGIFKSLNGGGSWNPVNTGIVNLRVIGLAINPLTPTTLYAQTDGDLFKSMDGGENWNAANTGLIGSALALAIDPKMPNTLYAGTWVVSRSSVVST